MLPKKHRINKKLFKEVFLKGKNFHTDLISVKAFFSSGEEPVFTFVVPSKTAKKAVDRNKLKRRARAIIKKHLSLYKKGVMAAFFFKKGSEKLNFQEIEKEIFLISKKAEIIVL